MVKIKTLLIIISVLILSACVQLFDLLSLNERFTITKSEQTTSKLKFNGYYYNYYYKNYLQFYIFYSSGDMYNSVYETMNGLKSLERHIYELCENSPKMTDSKLSWGLFNIDSNNIKMEIYGPSSGGPLKIKSRSYVILNDSTLLLKNSKFNNIDTFRFNEYLLKPDSTLSPYYFK